MCDAAPGIIDLLDRMGVTFNRTPEGLLDMAGRQVHAHLLKLKAEGKVEGSSVKATWSRVTP